MLECGGDASERRRTVAQAPDAELLVGAGERAVFDGGEIVNEIELRATEPSRDRTPQHTLRRDDEGRPKLGRVGEGPQPSRRIRIGRGGAQRVELSHVGVVPPRGGDVRCRGQQRIIDVNR